MYRLLLFTLISIAVHALVVANLPRYRLPAPEQQDEVLEVQLERIMQQPAQPPRPERPAPPGSLIEISGELHNSVQRRSVDLPAADVRSERPIAQLPAPPSRQPSPGARLQGPAQRNRDQGPASPPARLDYMRDHLRRLASQSIAPELPEKPDTQPSAQLDASRRAEVQIQGDLAERRLEQLPTFGQLQAEYATRARVRIEARADGSISFVVMERRTGDPQLDRDILEFSRQIRFSAQPGVPAQRGILEFILRPEP